MAAAVPSFLLLPAKHILPIRTTRPIKSVLLTGRWSTLKTGDMHDRDPHAGSEVRRIRRSSLARHSIGGPLDFGFRQTGSMAIAGPARPTEQSVTLV